MFKAYDFRCLRLWITFSTTLALIDRKFQLTNIPMEIKEKWGARI
jgi:hypothetical protein